MIHRRPRSSPAFLPDAKTRDRVPGLEDVRHPLTGDDSAALLQGRNSTIRRLTMRVLVRAARVRPSDPFFLRARHFSTSQPLLEIRSIEELPDAAARTYTRTPPAPQPTIPQR